MYNYITIIVCLLFIIFSLKNKNIMLINPLLIFSFIWGMILILESLHLFNLKSVHSSTYFIIFVGVLFFGIGYFIVHYFRKKYTLKIYYKDFTLIDNDTSKGYVLRYKVLCIIGIICIIYYLKHFPIIVQKILSGGNLGDVRMLIQDSTSILNERSGIENALRILIIIPFSLAVETITAVDFWLGRRHKPLLIISLVIIFLRVITEGGRTPIVNFIMYFIIAFILSNNHKSLKFFKNKKIINKIYLIFILFLGLFILYYTTISRDGTNTLKTIYYYFSIEPYMLNVWGDITNNNGIFGWGAASLNGFIFPILYIIKNFFGIPFPTNWRIIYDLILLTDSQWQIISTDGIRANAYVSIFWFFYLDGRIIGVIIGMLFYGIVVGNSFMSAIKYTNVKNVSIYLLILQGLFFSFIRFPFANMYYVIAFIMILFIAYKPIHKEENNVSV